MSIQHEIVGFRKSTGSLQVRYFSESLPGGMVLSVNLPVTNGRYPQGEALEALISNSAPKDIFERARANGVPQSRSVAATAARTDLELDNNGLGLHFVREGRERILLVAYVPKARLPDISVEVV